MVEESRDTKIFFVIAIICMGLALIGAILCRFFHINPQHLGYVKDWFMERTGLYCPGCGGTRAVLYLLYGNIPMAFVYHPGVGYMALLLVVCVGSNLLHVLSKRKIQPLRASRLYFYGLIVVILVQWIIKNIFVITMQLYVLSG